MPLSRDLATSHVIDLARARAETPRAVDAMALTLGRRARAALRAGLPGLVHGDEALMARIDAVLDLTVTPVTAWYLVQGADQAPRADDELRRRLAAVAADLRAGAIASILAPLAVVGRDPVQGADALIHDPASWAAMQGFDAELTEVTGSLDEAGRWVLAALIAAVAHMNLVVQPAGDGAWAADEDVVVSFAGWDAATLDLRRPDLV